MEGTEKIEHPNPPAGWVYQSQLWNQEFNGNQPNGHSKKGPQLMESKIHQKAYIVPIDSMTS